MDIPEPPEIYWLQVETSSFTSFSNKHENSGVVFNSDLHWGKWQISLQTRNIAKVTFTLGDYSFRLYLPCLQSLTKSQGRSLSPARPQFSFKTADKL